FGLVETVLIDLKGKIEGRPASELLGTQVRQRVPLVARSGLYLLSETSAQEASLMAERGFNAYRFRLGLGLAGDAETLRRVREALPGECRIVVDAQAWWQMGSEAYPPAEFGVWAGGLAAHVPLWLAEPFHPEDDNGCQRLVKEKTVPIAVGEHETSTARLEALAETGVDILQVNVSQLGGLLSCRVWLQSLAERGKRFVLTGATTPLEIVAMAHLASGFGDDVCLGIDWPCFWDGIISIPLAKELLKEPLAIKGGEVIVPDGPGFGVELDEAVLHRFPWKSGQASAVC
ncbi:MAG: mandelate racemase/muconate lactonizing enzyme family protein, partial [Acidobacteria bacterium]|nr:mandelate racemase/muconate lactonizing enzyme family protein [Acidobacteriota bacterium]